MTELLEKNIILDLQSRNKEGALREMASVLHELCPQLDIENLLQVLFDREMIGSTGVGHGVALPHGKVPELDTILLCFARSRNGISFDSIDNQPVHLLVMLLSPVLVIDEYLKTLAAISQLLKQPETRKLLRLTDSKQEILDIFKKSG